MAENEQNICTINALSGIDTASPQISQFSHNCSCIKLVIKKNLSDYAVVIITNADGRVSAVAEGDALVKTYDSDTAETTLMWYPSGEITAQSGCVVYQVAAYDADDNNTLWYSKEGRLIVTDSIDTTNLSTALVGSEPNLVMQILTMVQSSVNDINNLEAQKVDKSEGMGLSENDFTNELRLKLLELSNYDDTELREDISQNAENISAHASNKQNPHGVTKEQLGVDNYDDTELREDIFQNAEDISAHASNKQNPHGVTKEQLGVDNYDDTDIKADLLSLSQSLGDIDSALDAILTIQSELIGGDAS